MRHLVSFSLLVPLILLSACGEKISEYDVSRADVAGAESVFGLTMTDAEFDLMREDLAEQREAYTKLRDSLPPNSLRPALRFDPELLTGPAVTINKAGARWSAPEAISRPADLNELAFASVGQLGHLIKTRQVSCVELAELSLDRLRTHDPQLHCVITLLPKRALTRARELDQMLAKGIHLGPLHGIPFGAKDLLAVAGAPTTWGATPYQDQEFAETATVVTSLEKSGAVLVAKLTLGALAWGDVWFGGMTRNPWNLEQGSSGSSAGSASAVSAGLVPFAIGTETLGSIVSPSTRCGVTGLRPTFGRVSRHGAMALSWSMDKIGPIARSVEDCAMVFDAIRGRDLKDPTTVDRPFPFDGNRDLNGLRIGYLSGVFDEDYPGSELDNSALDLLRAAGADLVPMTLPVDELGVDPYDISFILSAEAGAAFQELALSGRDDELVRQVRYAWPNVFRAAQFIPAVEYIQANRQRVELMAMMARVFNEVDVYVTPSLVGRSLVITNLTGHPQVVVPAGFIEDNAPHSISFVGRLFDEATVMAVARAYEQAADWHQKHPPGF
ncbi:MAG: Asp-tRNA(Asn)/Glu-tRNA(Gln) amidotransferase A subunit family amidase [Candidatus Krumholzibacteriia bacterium]|jgi:Asp-tRNA(Asn)/Glu-tRNA(Gln) amidotransferase A subunit family amidase